MTQYIATCSQNLDEIGFQFYTPIDGARTVYYSVNGQNWTTSGNVASGNITWTGWDFSDDGLCMMVAANRSAAALIAPIGTATTIQATMLPAGTAWKKCVYGNGSFVSVNTSTTAAAYMRHKEGIGWTSATLPSAAAWSLLAFGNNTFVTIAPSSTASAYSINNGLTWSPITLPASLAWIDLKFANGYFVLVANGSSDVYTSPDGQTWTLRSSALPSAAAWSMISWANLGGVEGTWVCVPSTGTTGAYSTDNGSTWTASVLPASANWIVAGGKAAWDGVQMFTALSVSSTNGAFSYDGINWSLLVITSASYNREFKLIQPRLVSGDGITVNNNATLTVNTDQKRFLAGTSALLVTNGKVLVQNNSTTTPIRFGTGRLAVGNVLSTIDCTNGLGTFETAGDWIELGSSTGAADQTFTSPYSTGDYIPTVWVETFAGSNDYEAWVNVTGAPDYNQFNYFRNGFRSVGDGDGGAVFIQDADQTSCQYKMLANTNALANTNIITCTSTTGLVPGTWVYSRSINAVVQEVLSATVFTINVVVTYTLSSSTAGFSNIPMVSILPLYAQNTPTLRFGNDVNGKIPPVGAKIRVPNILLTDYSPANYMNGVFASGNAPFHLRTSAGGGKFTFDKTLFGESYSNFTQAASVMMTDCGGSCVPFVSECYQVSLNNVAFALPPVRQVVTSPVALGATGSCTATSVTVGIPASTAIIPGMLITGTGIHAATVSTVNSTTSIAISTAAHTTSATVAYSYYGPWVSREHRMLLSASVGFGNTMTNAPWTYVSNANLQKVTMTFGGHQASGMNSNPGPGSTYAGFLGFGYSNDVVVNNFKGIQVGSYPKVRPNNTAFSPNTAGANHTYSNVKLYNVGGVMGCSVVSNTNISNVTHRQGINNEGYNWASLCRVFSDVKNEIPIPKDTQYWFKTRSYKTNDFQDTTSYIDSMPMSAVHGNFPKYLQMPQRVGIVPKYALEITPALAYGNGSWVFLSGEVGSGANTAMVSDDNGATWTAYQLPVAAAGAGVYYRNIIWSPTQNYFVAIGGGANNTNFVISKNGKDWSTNTNAIGNSTWNAIAFDNAQTTNKWVGMAGGVASTTSFIASITNGVFTFVTPTGLQTSGAASTWIDVTSNGAGRWVAISGGIAVGTASSWLATGTVWTTGGVLASSLWQSIAFGSTRFVAISASATNGPTAYSADGVTWTAGTAATLPTGMTYTKIIFTGSVFVALAGPAYTTTSHNTFLPVTTSSCFCTSTDGITWSALKYLPDSTQWVGISNNGNAVGVISTITSKFAYTSDISVATPVWTLYSDVLPVHNRISIFHQSTEFTQALNTAAAVATTLNNTTVTCTSTAGLQVGTIVTFSGGNMVATGAMYFGNGSLSSQTGAAIVTSITNGTTFVINKPALRTATGLTATFYKGVYSLYRSTTHGFTARDATTLIGSTQSITAGQMLFGDTHGVTKDTTYYYRLRKLSGGGTASITNCSGAAAASTITTQGSWYYWQSSFDLDGKVGTNVISSLVFNFFSAGIIPGAIVTGPGIPAGTTVIDVPDFDTIILSANLTSDVLSRGSDRTFVGFSPAPGMYIFGSNVGLDSVVDTVNSATSMTVSVANTNTFTNQTLRFVVGQELPEFAAIATAPKVIVNQVLQSDALATTWTASGITATNAAAYSPLDITIGVNGTAAAGTGCSLYASVANGTLTQTVKTGVGTTYTFSIYLRARHPDLRSYITTNLTLGTSTSNLTLTNQWKRYSVSFITTANTTNAVIQLPLLGSVVEAAKAMVTVGDDIPCPVPAQTTAITAFLPQQLLAITDGLSGYFLYDAPAGIVTNLQTAPVGQLYAHLHVDTTSGFTISDQNQVYSTEGSGTDITFGYASSTNHVVDNYNPVNTLIADRNTLVYPSTGTNGITIKNSVIPFNGSTGNLLNYTTAGYNIYLHNITMVNPRNYIAAIYYDSVINNASSGIKFQNVKSTLSGKSPWGAQSLDTIYKGVPGCDSAPVNNQVTWNLSSNPTQDSLPVATGNLAAVYDNMFHEMTFGSANKGCLDLRMSPSNKVVKPYNFISGSMYFDNSGGLAFTTNNDVAIFEWPHFIKGITGFSKRMPHIYGIDIGLSPVTSIGTLIEYDLDRGIGYSDTWKTVNGFNGISNLSSESAIDPLTGFKIKFRVSAKYVLKYTGQAAQFVVGETLTNNVLASSATATAVVVADETVSSATTGSLVCSNVTGAWVTGDTIFSNTLKATITNTTLSSNASMTSSNISGTTLTVGTLASGTILPGMLVTGTGVTSGTYIVSNIAGSGSGSTWTVNFPQGVVSTTLTGGYSSVTVDSTANLYPSMGFRITSTIGGMNAGTTYYVHAVVNSTTFTVTTSSYGSTAVSLSNAAGTSTLVGIHGTITAVNTIGVFAPQPTSKLMAVRIFTDLDNSPVNNYPASVNTLTINGLQIGSDITIIESGTETVLSNTENWAGTSYGYIYEVAKTVDIVINKPGFYPAAIRNYTLTTSDASVPIIQPPDLSYI